ncbi:ATP-binding cassette domain-containing protein [Marinomonas mediterranea]|uniref:ATP-binding cassette domain-containing protein n=1 Tax=Marinomonas mediterranea TaxID=119864 RepID=UPI00234B5A0C|nr:ATP-binding cassette domain-containing protein [Marinomonas mediterranea]WCN08148.1 ATP-binding cassette domain-containing protein [Marinomonas mediterranea]WCN12217.1 ATP-binding cassette domain-containing protein [Marinomonas mediterranea]
MPQFALELCDLSRHFMLKNGAFKAPTLLKAVDGVSLRIAPGETLGLVGESGCGKSTLAKMILGLLPPTEGNVLVNDEAINHGDRLTLAKQLQPIFQDPYSSLNPRKTIRQIICLPLQLHKVGDKKSQQAAVKQMSDLVGLPERLLDQYPGQLSGGQRQRVAIARALILKPSILVCDEPTSALDVSVQAQILNLLMDLKQELGLTYLFISHNLGVVEHLVDRVAVMYRGQLVEQGSREDIFQNAKHPYTQALLSSVLTPEPALGLPELIDDSAWASAS